VITYLAIVATINLLLGFLLAGIVQTRRAHSLAEEWILGQKGKSAESRGLGDPNAEVGPSIRARVGPAAWADVTPANSIGLSRERPDDSKPVRGTQTSPEMEPQPHGSSAPEGQATDSRISKSPKLPDNLLEALAAIDPTSTPGLGPHPPASSAASGESLGAADTWAKDRHGAPSAESYPADSQQELSRQSLGESPGQAAATGHPTSEPSVAVMLEAANLPSPAKDLVVFGAELSAFRQEILDLDRSARAETAGIAYDQIEALGRKLNEAADRYQQAERTWLGVLQGPAGPASMAGLPTQLWPQTLRQFEAQISESREVFWSIVPDTPAEQARNMVLGEATKLLGGADEVRDLAEHTACKLEVPAELVAISFRSIGERSEGLANRAQLEASIKSSLENDPHRQRRLSVALIDVDHMRQLNRTYGSSVGDRLLLLIAKLLSGEQRGDMLVGRYTGQQFFWILPHTDWRSAVALTERIRQTLELTVFEYQGVQIRLTVSAAITEALRSDTAESLLERLRQTLREAKRYGGNRTFINDGRFPSPVVPPNLPIEEKRFAI